MLSIINLFQKDILRLVLSVAVSWGPYIGFYIVIMQKNFSIYSFKNKPEETRIFHPHGDSFSSSIGRSIHSAGMWDYRDAYMCEVESCARLAKPFLHRRFYRGLRKYKPPKFKIDALSSSGKIMLNSRLHRSDFKWFIPEKLWLMILMVR